MKGKQYTPDPTGFRNKYTVLNKDGTLVEGPTFTLRPYDPHAQKALKAYARSVKRENPGLARDLSGLVDMYNETEQLRRNGGESLIVSALADEVNRRISCALGAFLKPLKRDKDTPKS